MRALAALMLLMTVGAVQAAQSGTGPPVKEPKYGSAKPMYLNIVFGEDPKGMLMVIDESKGTGKGYDRAYFDESMEGDLTNDAPKPFAMRQGSSLGPSFTISGPCPYKKDSKATYELTLYSLNKMNSKTVKATDNNYWCTMTDDQKWSFFFINGSFNLYPSAAAAIGGKPLVLAGKCHWDLTAKQAGAEVSLSVGLKDTNGCTLRSVTSPNGAITPLITVFDKAGKEIVRNQKLGFG